MTPIKFRLIREGKIVGYEESYLGEHPKRVLELSKDGQTIVTSQDNKLKVVKVCSENEGKALLWKYTTVDGVIVTYIPHDHKDRLVTVQNKVEIYENDLLQYRAYSRPFVGHVQYNRRRYCWIVNIKGSDKEEPLFDILAHVFLWDWEKVGSKWEE